MIELAELIEEMEVYAPVGLELPRDPVTNQVRQSTIQRWAEDGAGEINAKRGLTTLKETNITTLDDVQDYDLPDGCREVVKIQRERGAPSTEVLGVPVSQTTLGTGFFGQLPSGQEISGSLDLIQRQRLARVRREDDYEIFEGKLRLLFEVTGGEVVRVTYRAVDRSLDNVPADRFTMLLTYCLIQNLEWKIGKGSSIVVDGDRLDHDTMAGLVRRKLELEARWLGMLNAIEPEAG